MFDLNFEAGEVRRFQYLVSAQSPKDTIIITEASWVLINKDSGETVEDGDCEIEDKMIELLVPLREKGNYYIEVTAKIPPEVIIERLNIKVI